MNALRNRASTLIELLLAVAIVALLVVIALPRYEASQLRSRVSQARGDLRNLGIALEAYAVDNQGNYPFDIDPRGWPWYVTDVLSTPVAYLRNASMLQDPCRTAPPTFPALRRYRYVNYPANLSPGWPPCYLPLDAPFHYRWDGTNYDYAATRGMAQYGKWKLSAAGADGVTETPFFYDVVVYDPSNGTVSRGDIVRPQRN